MMLLVACRDCTFEIMVGIDVVQGIEQSRLMDAARHIANQQAHTIELTWAAKPTAPDLSAQVHDKPRPVTRRRR